MEKACMFKKYTDTNTSPAVFKIWKLKISLFPKTNSSLPIAKMSYQNEIVSHPKDLTNLLEEEYGRIRLRKRPIHPLFNKEKSIKKKIVKAKLQIASKKKTCMFKTEDLEYVLKGIKGNKARYPEGISRIIFKNSIVCSNLKESLLVLFNKLKIAGTIPEFMKKAVVTTIPKKGKQIILKNERGIFLVSCARSILMRLIYNLKSSTLDTNMSDSNVGGRKNKSGINHIWVMQSIIHRTLSSVRQNPIIIQQYDYRQ